ncbi:MAG: hypothetical protein ABFD54_15035 [Armatimonadota bacterium]
MTIQTAGNSESVQDVIEDVLAIPKSGPQIVHRSLMYAGRRMKTAAKRAIKETYFVKSSELQLGLIEQHSRVSKDKEMWFQVKAIGERIDLFDFKVSRRTPTKKHAPPGGVRVQVRKDGTVTTWRHGFIAQMDSGHIGLFFRDVNNSKYKQKPRDNQFGFTWLPIYEGVGVSIAEMLKTVDAEQDIEENATLDFQKELDRQMSLFLSKGSL